MTLPTGPFARYFLTNADEARACGYDTLCAYCGCGGVEEDPDMHAFWCETQTPDFKDKEATDAAAFAARFKRIIGEAP